MQETNSVSGLLEGENLWSVRNSIETDVWDKMEVILVDEGLYYTLHELSEIKNKLRTKTGALVSLAPVMRYNDLLELVLSQIELKDYLD